MKRIIIAGLIILIGLLGAVPASANIGVGLCCGFSFDMGELRKGQSYDVGKMCILNTGDEPTCYKMNMAYHSGQPEREVAADWVWFEPETFCLKPYTMDDIQIVEIGLDIPTNAKKADYFAYLEACTDTDGTVGVCVASKLSFSIVPGRSNGSD